MFYSVWLLAAALAGWAGGEIAGDDGFGRGADILLGITGAFVVRWSLENIGISLHEVYLLLFSIWGAAAFPVALRFGIRRHHRSRARSGRSQSFGFLLHSDWGTRKSPSRTLREPMSRDQQEIAVGRIYFGIS